MILYTDFPISPTFLLLTLHPFIYFEHSSDALEKSVLYSEILKIKFSNHGNLGSGVSYANSSSPYGNWPNYGYGAHSLGYNAGINPTWTGSSSNCRVSSGVFGNSQPGNTPHSNYYHIHNLNTAPGIPSQPYPSVISEHQSAFSLLNGGPNIKTSGYPGRTTWPN